MVRFTLGARVASVVAVSVTLAVWLAGASTALASSGWTIQQTPNPTGASRSTLSAVSCTSATACTAVGNYVIMSSGANLTLTLAERWDGNSWSIQTTPNPAGATSSSLSGVSCTSPTACTAVGYSGGVTLAERWDGNSWSIQTTPNPAGATSSSLSGVSCTAAGCIAVGQSNGAPLAESWNGSAWSTTQPIPLPAGANGGALSGVACASQASCTAVGYRTFPYCVKSGGTRWCRNIPATLAEGWNGSSWSTERTPSPESVSGRSILSGVSCTSATACTAVGYFVGPIAGATLAEYWNGSNWSYSTGGPTGSGMPNISGGASLSAVSCISATVCTATGQGNGVGLVEVSSFSGWITWTTQPTPSPASSILSGVSCPSTTSCAAVGNYLNSSGVHETLAESYSP